MGTVDSRSPGSPALVSLSPLQQRVVSIVASVPGAADLGLAGGAALLAWGVGERTTRDLDFFATRAETVDAFGPALERELRARGLHVEAVRSSPGFVRYEIRDGDETTELDLAWDYRMRPLQRTSLGLTLDRDELAADKVLALYGRAEARDFVDVFRLRAYYSRERLCDLAREKDHGFVENMFADTLARMERRDRIEFDVDDATLDQLRREFTDWRGELSRATPDLEATPCEPQASC